MGQSGQTLQLKTNFAFMLEFLYLSVETDEPENTESANVGTENPTCRVLMQLSKCSCHVSSITMEKPLYSPGR